MFPSLEERMFLTRSCFKVGGAGGSAGMANKASVPSRRGEQFVEGGMGVSDPGRGSSLLAISSVFQSGSTAGVGAGQSKKLGKALIAACLKAIFRGGRRRSSLAINSQDISIEKRVAKIFPRPKARLPRTKKFSPVFEV